MGSSWHIYGHLVISWIEGHRSMRRLCAWVVL